jgi:FkbM family methyltransferase
MITREHAIWAYRLFLDREPENEAVITEWLDKVRNTKDLRADFMFSPEFAGKNPDLIFTGDSNVVIKEIANGLRLFVDLSDHVIGWGIIRGVYERNELNFARRTIKPKQNVVDIGAHIGLFTMTMAALVGPEGRVYSFEPLTSEQSLLARSVGENGFVDRVVIECAAVSDHQGEGQLIVPVYTVNSGGAHLLGSVPSRLQQGHATNTVKLLKLDEYPLRRPVRFIKIDVEGAEPLALRGAADLLRTDRPIILSELHAAQLERVSGYTPEQFISDMKNYGYDTYSLGANGPTPFREGDFAEIRSIVFLPRES